MKGTPFKVMSWAADLSNRTLHITLSELQESSNPKLCFPWTPTVLYFSVNQFTF